MLRKLYVLIFIGITTSSYLFAQAATGEVKGVVKDNASNETIIGANILYAAGKGVTSDINGNYSISLEEGDYELTSSFIGYAPQKIKVKIIANKTVTINFSLQLQTLNEVEVIADVARVRETPIAFSNISAMKIQEELASRDLAMMLNSTPGAYATEQGGGSGDARVTIRGFDQRNIAVMVDGVPVNDMENGAVYWSNWDGLGDVTRTVQVQRGLGASKLAIASVGGTMNIITKGIESKLSTSVKQEVGVNGFLKTTLAFNSGQLKNGWGITMAGSRKVGQGWVDQTWTDSWSYFIKVQKRIGNHLISLAANGAPQSHGQRVSKMPIAIYDEALARKLGVNLDSNYKFSTYTTLTQRDRGLAYNPHAGTLDRGSGVEELNERVNYFHKPQITLSHFWKASEKLDVSTVAYLSIGTGGGTSINNTVARDTTNGEYVYQKDYNTNSVFLDPLYSTTEHKSSKYIYSSINNHIWYGLLSTSIYKYNSNLTFTGGLDLRYYKGEHYRTVYDLLGGDYVVNSNDKNQPGGSVSLLKYSMKREGDKINYYNDAIVMWGGLFAQAEYKKDKWSTFFTATVSETGDQRIDYFQRKDLVIDGHVFSRAVGYGQTYFYNGKDTLTAFSNSTITKSGDTTFVKTGTKPVRSIVKANPYGIYSPEARAATTEREWYLGYTLKGGANYNIDEHHNVFTNLGYLTMAPRFNNVFDNNNKKFLDAKNQKVYAFEIGYGAKYSKFTTNINLYYTIWKNKPPQFTPTINIAGDVFSYNINGLDAVHKGIELDGAYKLLRQLTLEGIVSVGDWRNSAARKVYISDQNNVVVDSVDFSAKDILVGDAAQIQLGGALRYEPIKGLYIKPVITYFSKNYANFDPIALTGVNKDRQSWKMPDYTIVELHAGYSVKYWKLRFTLTGSLINALDTKFITDAQNGPGFDASTAMVYFGQGRRFNLSLKIDF